MTIIRADCVLALTTGCYAVRASVAIHISLCLQVYETGLPLDLNEIIQRFPEVIFI